MRFTFATSGRVALVFLAVLFFGPGDPDQPPRKVAAQDGEKSTQPTVASAAEGEPRKLILPSVLQQKVKAEFIDTPIREALEFLLEDTKDQPESKEGSAIVESAIATFDKLIVKVNDRNVEDRSAHLKKVRAELEKEAKSLITKVNKLG